jgi:hypothetical protein
MKTAREWPKPQWHSTYQHQVAEAIRLIRFAKHIEAERQHWLDMAHPMPKRKGAK